MTEIARAVARANGLDDRIVVLAGLSSHVSLPEQVDAIVCDQIGHFGFEAGLLEYGADARRRFLKPGGAMLPARIDIALAPVEQRELFDRVQFWLQRPAGFDFAPAHEWAVNTGYPFLLESSALLAPAAIAHSIDMAAAGNDPFAFGARFTAARRGVLHGIGGWFSAQLSPGVRLTNAPDAAARLQRRNVFLPVAEAVPVSPPDTIAVDVHVIPPDTVTWTVEVWRDDGRVFRSRHSTSNGMLMQREELRRMNPRYVPALTDRGTARLTVLTLCDGRTPLAEVEREVFARHTDLFATHGEAAAFVAEVVTRYSR
jgi:hypothetical protein